MTEGESPLGDAKRAFQDAVGDAKRAFRETLAVWHRISDGRKESNERRQKRIEESRGKDPQIELARIVAEQRSPDVARNYEKFRGLGYENSGSNYMETFRESPFYEAIKQRVGEVMSREGEFHPGEVSGLVFEYLAYGLLAAEEAQKGNLVISPEATFAFYRDIIYPEGEEIEWDFSRELIHKQEDIEFSYVPDGFIVNQEGKIVGIAEYKPTSNGLRHQIRRSPGLIEKLRARNLLGNEEPRLVFVTLRVKPGKNVTDVDNNISHNHLINFTSREFRSEMEPLLTEMGNISTRSRIRKPQRYSS